MGKMQCLDAFNRRCNITDCPHYKVHDEILKTHRNKIGYIVRACDQDIHAGSHTNCTPCIEVKEASHE